MQLFASFFYVQLFAANFIKYCAKRKSVISKTCYKTISVSVILFDLHVKEQCDRLAAFQCFFMTLSMYHQYQCRTGLISKKKVFTLFFVKSFSFAIHSETMSRPTSTSLTSAMVLTFFLLVNNDLPANSSRAPSTCSASNSLQY